MLNRFATAAVTALVVALVMVACGSAPPPAADPMPPAPVAARWVAEDGTVVAVNVVVSAGLDAQHARAIAERERAGHPRARVIVRIFAVTAGPERFVIGHVPAGKERLEQASPPATLLGVYDFPP